MRRRGYMWIAVTCAAGALASAPAAAAPPFSTPVAISGPDSNYPVLAMNARGDLVVGFTNVYDTRPRVEAVTQPAGALFRPPTSLPAASYNFPVTVAVAPDGAASVLWRQTDQPTAGPSQVWQANGPVTGGLTASGPIGDVPAFHLAVNSRGDALAVWLDPNSQGDVMAAWRPAGQAFGSSQLIARGAYGGRSVAFEPDGRPLVVFNAVEPGHPAWDPARVYLVSGDAGGRFGSPVALSDAGLDVRSTPKVATSPRGDAIVTWTAGQPRPNYNPMVQGIAPPNANLVQAAVRRPGDGFAPAVTLASAGFADSTNAAMDRAGDALVVWQGTGGEHATFLRADGQLRGPHTLPGSCPCTAQDAVGFDAHGNAVVVFTFAAPGRDPRTHKPLGHKVLSAVRRPDGAWAPTQRLFLGYASRGPTLFLSELGFDGFGRGAVAFGTNADGRIHVAAYDSARLTHAGVLRSVGLNRTSRSISYRLTRPALTRIVLERAPALRRSRSSRPRPRPVRNVLVSGRPGLNRVALGGPRVASGRYRLTVRALDIAGRPLATRRLTVRL